MKSKRLSAKRIATLSILTALGLISFLIENLVPISAVPFARLGIANIFSFAALIIYSPVDAFIVVVARTLLGAMFAGNFSALMYSFTAGIVSMAVSSALMYALYPKVSVMAISVTAAVCHNITQYLVFVLLSGATLTFGFLFVYLLALGAVSGAIIGGVTLLIFRAVPQQLFYGRIRG